VKGWHAPGSAPSDSPVEDDLLPTVDVVRFEAEG